jgi:hypothetical protein
MASHHPRPSESGSDAEGDNWCAAKMLAVPQDLADVVRRGRSTARTSCIALLECVPPALHRSSLAALDSSEPRLEVGIRRCRCLGACEPVSNAVELHLGACKEVQDRSTRRMLTIPSIAHAGKGSDHEPEVSNLTTLEIVFPIAIAQHI